MMSQEGKDSGHNILIVEDDAIVAVNLRSILTRQGYNVLKMVSSGEEALLTLGIEPAVQNAPARPKAVTPLPDLVLMDIRLDGQLNGIETAAQIRVYLDVPLIYLTSHAEDVLLQQAKLTEPYGYLVKPIQHQELYATIEMALYKHKMEKALRNSEEKLKVYSEHLEEMVEERTQKLQEAWERLLRQERLAIMGQLVGGVAHELRNPLAAIKAVAYVLKTACNEASAEENKALEILEKEVDMAEQIIANLLDFAQPRAPTLTQVNINEVIRAALLRVSVPIDVEVVTQLDETLPLVQADPNQLNIILVNLMSNAIQAMFKGGRLMLTSSLVKNGDKANGGPWVTIAIADTGAGIPPENLEKIFEPLFTTRTKGIGLGLPLSKTLVEKQGGSIEVTSQPGQGTTFTIRLCAAAPQGPLLNQTGR